MGNRKEQTRTKEDAKLNTALYIRLSREDGDKAESLSVANQRMQLMEFMERQSDLRLHDVYVDDGHTGTNFERPAFKRMIEDIEAGNVQCVLVKDLSRLGRNLPEVSKYTGEYFPHKRVRFIAVNDLIDRNYLEIDPDGDMMMDFKNMCNGFYPRDISKKVRSTFRSKQNSGQFIGAFASFGYVKSAEDHNRLEIDPCAADIVKRIFAMYIKGHGQNTIAKILNEEGVPCPSEYKRQCGLNYHNGSRLGTTAYWTYSTVRNILRNEIYTGSMVQNKSFRQMCKKNAVSLPREKWIVVENTHAPVIDRETWDKVQDLLQRNTRQTGLTDNVHLFAGYLRCGDCGRAMVKIRRRGETHFNCGSYNRYGRKICTIHNITGRKLEEIVLQDLNLMIRSVQDIERLVTEENQKQRKTRLSSLGDSSGYQTQIRRLRQKKERTYEDYADGLITKDEYRQYRDKYEQQIEAASAMLAKIGEVKEQPPENGPWIERLLQYRELSHLDRNIVVEMVSMIYIYEDNTVKIVYNFSDEVEALRNGKMPENSKMPETVHQQSIFLGE